MANSPTSSVIPLEDLLGDIRSCRHCEEVLPLGARPVLRASGTARVVIVGQAPGTKVHASGIPWDDASGDRFFILEFTARQLRRELVKRR